MVKLQALISFIQGKKRSSKAKGRVERQKVDGLLAPEIPCDLMIEILTRLPAKSLMRFKCVSKIWSLFICSRYFSNLYLMVVSPRRPPCLCMSFLDHRYVYDSIKVWHSPRESQLLLLSSSTSNSDESNFDLDLTKQGMGGENMVVLRGLILYIVHGKACIYNPTTRQSIALPFIKPITFSHKVKGCRTSVHYLFGHDPVLDHYKIVCIVNVFSRGLKSFTSVHWVYVLESGGFWKRIDYQPHFLTRRGLCIRGVIYYFAYTDLSCHVIVSFDVRSEQLNMIQVPQELSGLIFDHLMDLIEYGGKPAIFDHTYLVLMGNVDLWVLEDSGKWSKKSLVLHSSQMNLLNESIALVLRGTTQNGEVILAPSKLLSNYYLLYYDLQKNDMRKVNVVVTSDHWFGKGYFDFILIDKNESILHLET